MLVYVNYLFPFVIDHTPLCGSTVHCAAHFHYILCWYFPFNPPPRLTLIFLSQHTKGQLRKKDWAWKLIKPLDETHCPFWMCSCEWQKPFWILISNSCAMSFLVSIQQFSVFFTFYMGIFTTHTSSYIQLHNTHTQSVYQCFLYILYYL